jgi:hypothetical protein
MGRQKEMIKCWRLRLYENSPLSLCRLEVMILRGVPKASKRKRHYTCNRKVGFQKAELLEAF